MKLIKKDRRVPPATGRMKKGDKRHLLSRGRRLSQEARDFRKASREEIIIEYKYLWTLREDQLKEVVDDPDTPGIRRWMAKVITEGIKHSNLHHLEIIFDRIYGRAQQNISVEGSVHSQLAAIFGADDDGKNKK